MKYRWMEKKFYADKPIEIPDNSHIMVAFPFREGKDEPQQYEIRWLEPIELPETDAPPTSPTAKSGQGSEGERDE